MCTRRYKINNDQVTVIITGLLFLIFGMLVILKILPNFMLSNTIAVICGWLFIAAGAIMLVFAGYWIYSDLADDRNVRQDKNGTKPNHK